MPPRILPATLSPGLCDRGSILAERYYEALEAPQGKELVWFEDPPHVTYAEEPEIFDQEMLPVRHETYHREGRFLWPNG